MHTYRNILWAVHACAHAPTHIHAHTHTHRPAGHHKSEAPERVIVRERGGGGGETVGGEHRGIVRETEG